VSTWLSEVGAAARSPDNPGGGAGANGLVAPPADLDEPATPEQWERAKKAGLTATKAKAFAKAHGIEVASAAELTKGQLADLIQRWLER